MFTHPKTVNCAKAAQATLQMVLKSALNRNKPQNVVLAKEVLLKADFNHSTARQLHRLCVPVLPVTDDEKETHGTLVAFNTVLEDAQTSVHNLTGQRQTNITLHILHNNYMQLPTCIFE